jgi:hypothetical protein
MFDAYLKQLVVDGGGAFTVCRISAETEEALKVKRDVYLADDWQDATEEEYRAQFAARTAPVEGEDDKALGEKAPEVQAEEGAADQAEAEKEAAAEDTEAQGVGQEA